MFCFQEFADNDSADSPISSGTGRSDVDQVHHEHVIRLIFKWTFTFNLRLSQFRGRESIAKQNCNLLREIVKEVTM